MTGTSPRAGSVSVFLEVLTACLLVYRAVTGHSERRGVDHSGHRVVKNWKPLVFVILLLAETEWLIET